MKSKKREFLLFCIAVLLISIAKIVYAYSSDLPFKSWEDHDIAQNLLTENSFYYNNDGARNHSFQFPIYILLITLSYKVLGNQLVSAIVINILLGGCTTLLAYRLGEQVLKFVCPDINFSKRNWIAAIIGTLVLLHPAILYYQLGHVHPFSADLLFLVLLSWALWQFHFKQSHTSWLAFIFLLSFALLDRGSFIALLLPHFIILYKRLPPLRATRQVVVSLVFCAAFVAPWCYRNYKADKVYGLTSTTGKIIWKGNLPESNGSNFLENGKNYYAALSEEQVIQLGAMKVAEQNRFFMNLFWEQVSEKPVTFISAYFKKMRNFWWFRPQLGNELPKASWVTMYKVYHIIELLFLLVSAWLIGRKIWPLLAIPISVSLFQSIFYVESRHFLLMEPILLIIIAVTLGYALYQRKINQLYQVEEN